MGRPAQAVCVLNDEVIQEEGISRRYGEPVGLATDEPKGTLWLYTSSTIFEIVKTREARCCGAGAAAAVAVAAPLVARRVYFASPAGGRRGRTATCGACTWRSASLTWRCATAAMTRATATL